jgi:hypothetical protein
MIMQLLKYIMYCIYIRVKNVIIIAIKTILNQFLLNIRVLLNKEQNSNGM